MVTNEGDFRPSRSWTVPVSLGGMFVGREVLLDVGYAVARARFMEFIRSGWFTEASSRAHADGLSGLIRVGPFGAVLGASKLVRVQTIEPVPRDDALILPLRWEATGALGRLFPVFDADLVLTPADAGGSRLELKGVYRAPLASVGSAADRIVLHRVATATVRTLLRDVAQMITAPAVQPTGEAREGAGGIAMCPLRRLESETETPC